MEPPDLIPPRTASESEELLRLWNQHDRFNAFISENYPALDEPDTFDWQDYPVEFCNALGHWQCDRLGEMRSLSFAGMETI